MKQVSSSLSVQGRASVIRRALFTVAFPVASLGKERIDEEAWSVRNLETHLRYLRGMLSFCKYHVLYFLPSQRQLEVREI
jgi:hypothetical protein